MNETATITMRDDTSIAFVVAMLDTGSGVDDIPVALFELNELVGVEDQS